MTTEMEMEFTLKGKKTENVIPVTLKDGFLQISKHVVNQNALKQVIRWQLEQMNLSKADFTSFEWVDAASTSGTFDTPEIAPDGNSMTMGDHNGPGAKKGDLAYILKVEIDGVVYTSRTNGAEGVYKDPIIINR